MYWGANNVKISRWSGKGLWILVVANWKKLNLAWSETNEKNCYRVRSERLRPEGDH